LASGTSEEEEVEGETESLLGPFLSNIIQIDAEEEIRRLLDEIETE